MNIGIAGLPTVYQNNPADFPWSIPDAVDEINPLARVGLETRKQMALGL